jgi:hypothetical protein
MIKSARDRSGRIVVGVSDEYMGFPASSISNGNSESVRCGVVVVYEECGSAAKLISVGRKV